MSRAHTHENSLIVRSHRPDRDSTPCFSLEQASMSKSQHGLVRAELNEGARDCAEYMRLPDNRKALLTTPNRLTVAHSLVIVEVREQGAPQSIR